MKLIRIKIKLLVDLIGYVGYIEFTDKNKKYGYENEGDKE